MLGNSSIIDVKCHELFLLQTSFFCLGIYSSLEELAKAVDHHMVEWPKKILSYERWKLNSLYNESWGWCYVPIGTRQSQLTSGGASFIPLKKYYGHNLVAAEIRGEETHFEIT